MEVIRLREGPQIAWVTHAPPDYLLLFVEEPQGEHAVVMARFADNDSAWEAAAGLEGAEIVGAEVSVYCTLAGEAEQVVAHLEKSSAAAVSTERGTVSFVAVVEGAETRLGTSFRNQNVRVLASTEGDHPRCYQLGRQCPTCGEFRGKIHVLPSGFVMIDTRELRCRCDAISCRYCAAGKIRRPLTEHFDPERRAGRMPSFGYLVPCGVCQAAGQGPLVQMSA